MTITLSRVTALVVCGAFAASCGGSGGGGTPASPSPAPTAPTVDASAVAADVGELVGTATSVLLSYATQSQGTLGLRGAGGPARLAVQRLSLVCPAGGGVALEFDSDGSRTVPAGAVVRYTDCTFQGQHAGTSIMVTGEVKTTGSYAAGSPDAPVVGETAAQPGGTLAIDGRVKGDGGFIGLVGGQFYEVGCVSIGCVFTGPPDTTPPPNPSPTTPGSFQGTLNGKWVGTCSGVTVGGDFSVTIDQAGNVTGGFTGSEGGSISGTVSGSGTLAATGSAGLAHWGGTITRSGNTLSGTGTWSGRFEDENCSGGWSGSGPVS